MDYPRSSKSEKLLKGKCLFGSASPIRAIHAMSETTRRIFFANGSSLQVSKKQLKQMVDKCLIGKAEAKKRVDAHNRRTHVMSATGSGITRKLPDHLPELHTRSISSYNEQANAGSIRVPMNYL